MNNVTDIYCWEKNRKILTYNELGITGLRSVGHAVNTKAILPMTSHIHRDCIEIVVIFKGNQTYTAGDKTFSLTGRDVFISFLNQPHGSGHNPQGINEIIWFQIDMTQKTGFLGLSGFFAENLYDQLTKIQKHDLKTNDENLRTLKQAFDAFSKRDLKQTAIGQSQMITFLTKLLSYNNEDESISDNINKTIDYINENITEDIDLAYLSEISGLSESRFKHKFKEQLGVTPRDYINRLKIDKAKELLKTQDNVTDVALQLGFSSSNYFSVVFKRYTSYSPSEYQKSGSADDILK